MRLQYIFGLGGICGLEKKSTRSLGKIFEYVMAIVALLVLLQWHFEVSKLILPLYDIAINWVIWLFFVIESAIFLMLVDDKSRYLKQNWMNWVVIIVGIPLLFNVWFDFYRYAKPVLAIILLTPWMGLLKRSLTDNKLSTTLISVVVVVILAGVLISGMDPAIHNPWQGIWWAWVTMSTVGYGDYAPVSIAGRIVGAAIILLGLCFFAILTANFSSMFLKREVSKGRFKEGKDIKKVLDRIEDVEERDEIILQHLKSIEKRLDEIETKQK